MLVHKPVAGMMVETQRRLRDAHYFPTRRSSDLWLAQAVSWSGPLDLTAWRGNAARAPADSARLSARERTLADRKSTRLNSSHSLNSYAVFCLKTRRVSDEAVASAGVSWLVNRHV